MLNIFQHIPQGSIIRPLLTSKYINDFNQQLKTTICQFETNKLKLSQIKSVSYLYILFYLIIIATNIKRQIRTSFIQICFLCSQLTLQLFIVRQIERCTVYPKICVFSINLQLNNIRHNAPGKCNIIAQWYPKCCLLLYQR